MWHRMGYAVALFASLLGSVFLAGCEKKQSTFDLSNPKSAAISFASALERNEPDTARNAAIYGGDESDLVDALARFASNARRLRNDITNQFGANSVKTIQPKAMSDASVRLADADVLLENEDHATVRAKDGSGELHLKQADGQWKVDIGALILGADLHRSIDYTNAMADGVKGVADDLEAGKLKTVEETKVAFQQKMLAALNPRLAALATTMPTSAPASNPTTRASTGM